MNSEKIVVEIKCVGIDRSYKFDAHQCCGYTKTNTNRFSFEYLNKIKAHKNNVLCW